MDTDTRAANPGDLGGPVSSGLELRDALGGKFKDIDESSRQVLVEFPHETVDSFRTVFGTRAFADSFDRRLPVMCWMHDIRNPIGHALEAQVTPRVNEIRGQFDDFNDVPEARRAFSQINSGTITDFSFGFKGAKYERAEALGRGVRRIVSALMPEFSPVTIGSIPGAVATGLREDVPEVMELGQIIYLRDNKLVTPEGFRALMLEHYPDMEDKLVLPTGALNGTRDKQGDDQDADDPSGAAAADMVDGPRWDATDAGTMTATGPNDEILRVKPGADGQFTWKAIDEDGSTLAQGSAADQDAAKAACTDALKARANADWTIPAVVTADDIRSALETSHPGMASVLSESVISIGDPTEAGQRAATGPAATLISNTRDALDAALQYLDDVDTDALPDEVQQAVALTRAASVSSIATMETLGIEERADKGDDDGGGGDDGDDGDDAGDSGDDGDPDSWDDGDWDGSASNFTDDQYKKSALIDTGSGDTPKERYALPVRTPEGKLSKKGIAAAAGRIGSVDAPDDEKAKAAKKLMGFYGKMKKDVPPAVLAATGNQRAASESRLDEMLSRRAAPADAS